MALLVPVFGMSTAAWYLQEPLPGWKLGAAALVLSGLTTDRFVFDGFLPRKGSSRTQRLTALAMTTPREEMGVVGELSERHRRRAVEAAAVGSLGQ